MLVFNVLCKYGVIQIYAKESILTHFLCSHLVYLAARRPTAAAVRPFLLRRGTATTTTGGSFKRRSLKLRRNTKDGKDLETDCMFAI